MLHKSKFRRKATRIAVAEIMIPIILIIVLGITVCAFVFKLITLGLELPDGIYSLDLEERTEMKWIINLGVVIGLSVLDLTMAYFIYTGVKEKSYNKCRLWVRLQIGVLCTFTFAVIKRCSAVSVAGGFEMFEFIILCVCIYIYKIHHVTFVYGLLEGLRITPSKRKANDKLFRPRKSSRIWKNAPRPNANTVTGLVDRIEKFSEINTNRETENITVGSEVRQEENTRDVEPVVKITSL